MSKMKKLLRLTLIGCVVFTLLFMSLTIQSDDSINVGVSMTPYKIILNAQCVGEQQDIQAIVSVSPAVYENIQDKRIELYFEGYESDIFTTDVFSYCYVDSNMLVSFDRLVIQEKLKELGISGITTATVTGKFVDDNSELVTFIGTDSVEILSPSKK
jgi:hypothetical protein